MRIARRTLYLGVFLVSFGAVWLLARDQADAAWLTGALRLWPLVVIAIGVGILLRRTRLALAGGILAAAVPGLLLGGVAVAAPSMSVDCGTPAGLTRTAEGSFEGPAVVTLEVDCGSATIDTAAGNGWTIDSLTGSDAAAVRSTPTSLTVASIDRSGPRFGWTPGRGDWRATLPTGMPLDLRATVNAGTGSFDLAGARLGNASFLLNAGRLTLDLGTATFQDLSVRVNAGDARISLPSTSEGTANVTVAAGRAVICVPAGLGIRVVRNGELGEVRADGYGRIGDSWESPGYETALHRLLVNLTVNVGSVDLASEGACK